MKTRILNELVVMGLIGIFFVHMGFSQESESLKKLIREALENNPGLKSAGYRVELKERAVPQAGALPDPQLSFGLMNMPVNSFDFNQEPMTGKQISVMQQFPFPGKLALSTDIAELEASIAKYQKEEMKNQLILMVKQAYYDIYKIDKSIDIVQSNQQLLEQLLEVAQKKYETGTGLQQDVLRAQVEFSKLEDELIMWQQKRQAAVANLNALLNRPANQKISKVTDIVIHTQDSEPTMDKPIEEIRPLLKSWKVTLQKADKTIKLAEKQYWPNFTIGASYTQRDDLKSGMIMHDFFSASISLNIPLYLKRKQSNQVQEKQFSLMSVREEYQNIKNRVYADLENTKAELTRYKKQIQLYNEGVILQAGQSLESARAGYQVNKVDFLTVINNWMNLQLYELQLHKAIANYHKSYAKYQFITGNTKN